MFYRRKKVERSYFRKLPTGAPYWLSSNIATSPFIKVARRSRISGWSPVTGLATLTAITDVGVAVVKVPQVFTGQNTVLK